MIRTLVYIWTVLVVIALVLMSRKPKETKELIEEHRDNTETAS